MGVSRLQRMHSAEHILTAVMRREFGSPRNLESHLGDKKSKCDYAVSQALPQEDILTIERAVNAEIEKDYPITVQVLPIEEAQQDYDLQGCRLTGGAKYMPRRVLILSLLFVVSALGGRWVRRVS